MGIPCKRCLLQEMGDEEIYKRIRRTIDIIPREKKTEEKNYQKRLEACKHCEKLLNGMCRVCGCYVEVRAAWKEEHCPAAGEKLW